MANSRQDAAVRAARLTVIGEQQRQVERRRTARITGVSVLVGVGRPRPAASAARAHPPVVTMAEAALELVGDEDVRRLAQAIVSSLTVEVTVLDRMVDSREDSPADR